MQITRVWREENSETRKGRMNEGRRGGSSCLVLSCLFSRLSCLALFLMGGTQRVGQEGTLIMRGGMDP